MLQARAALLRPALPAGARLSATTITGLGWWRSRIGEHRLRGPAALRLRPARRRRARARAAQTCPRPAHGDGCGERCRRSARWSGWRSTYFLECCRLALIATVLLIRCCERLTPGKRRVLERYLRAETLAPGGFLAARSLPPVAGRSQRDPRRASAGWRQASSGDTRSLLALGSGRAWPGVRQDASLPEGYLPGAECLAWRLIAILPRHDARRSGSATFYEAGPTPGRLAVGAPGAGNGPVPVAIEVRDVSKTFQLPGHRLDTIKERVVHPFARPEVHDLHALRNVSFDVRRGEFFGIVGRNGSGKSTLLKILASIYQADSGRIRMAGTLAPFIELGVGFNTDLTAEENIVLNGVMMGLTRERGAGADRQRPRVRRAGGVHRHEAEELLVGDAGPACLLGDARRPRPTSC